MFAKYKVFRAGFSLSHRFFGFFSATARPLAHFGRLLQDRRALAKSFASSVPSRLLPQLRRLTHESEQV
jgi:hypothetical protein